MLGQWEGNFGQPFIVVPGRERSSASEPGTLSWADEHFGIPGSRSAGAAHAPE